MRIDDEWRHDDDDAFRVDERVIVKKKVVTKQVVVKKRWKNGQRYDSWRNAKGMKDYSRYGLRRPGPGQRVVLLLLQLRLWETLLLLLLRPL